MYYLTGIWSYSRLYSARMWKTRTRITPNTENTDQNNTEYGKHGPE